MLSLGGELSVWEQPLNYLKKNHIYSEVCKLGQRELISGAVLNYVNYLSPKRQNLPPECCKRVGFAILFLIQDSSWAIPIWEAEWDSSVLKASLFKWRAFFLSDEERDWLKFSNKSRFRAKPSEELQRKLCGFLTGSGWSKDQTQGLSLLRDGPLLIHAWGWEQEQSLSAGALGASWNDPASLFIFFYLFCQIWG